MAGDRREPDDPLSFIRRCVAERRIHWSYHVNMRMRERFIAREQVLGAVATYEIIEAHPRDKYLPSYYHQSEIGESCDHRHCEPRRGAAIQSSWIATTASRSRDDGGACGTNS